MNENTMKRLWDQWLKEAEAYNAVNLSSKERREIYEKTETNDLRD
jgi:hypothetical protein